MTAIATWFAQRLVRELEQLERVAQHHQVTEALKQAREALPHVRRALAALEVFVESRRSS